MAVALLGALSCTVVSKTPTPSGPAQAAAGHELDERAVLLELADRKQFEPVIVQRVLGSDVPARAALATALGRIGDPRGLDALRSLLTDPAVQVRRAAAFNLGLLGEKKATDDLLRAVTDADEVTGRLAVEALGKLEAPVGEVERRLAAMPDADQRYRRLLPSLYRFHDADALAIARLAVTRSKVDERRWAAYAIARDPVAEGLPDVRRLLTSADALVRSWSARAIGKVGAAGDLERLEALLSDQAAGVVIEALRAGQALVADGRAAPIDDWRAPLLRLMDSPLPGVRLTAIEASGYWLPDQALGRALAERAGGASGRVRQLALLALARGADPRARALIQQAVTSPDRALRQAAAAAAAAAGADRALLRLSRDPDPGVRAAAIGEILDRTGPALQQVRDRALADPDPVVRAITLDDLATHPERDWRRIVAAMDGPGGEALTDVRISGVEALRARGQAVDAERTQIQSQLLRFSHAANYLVRRAAAAALKDFGLAPDEPEPVQTGKDLATYRQIVMRTRARPQVLMSTARGDIRLRLDCPEAPLTCLSFIQLANQGFFDGLTFHRVVPDFVVQGGDPLGNGWGGPGYALRDEINRLRYDRGALGMALSGPDTGGSQFFITLSPQPHLDGRYTVFGHVVGGDAVLDRLIQGDRIQRVVILPDS